MEKEIVDKMENEETERLINLLKEKKVSNGVIMLTLFGIGTHTEYYDVLYNRINNIEGEITDDIVKKEVLDIFHEIDLNDDYDEDDE